MWLDAFFCLVIFNLAYTLGWGEIKVRVKYDYREINKRAIVRDMILILVLFDLP